MALCISKSFADSLFLVGREIVFGQIKLAQTGLSCDDKSQRRQAFFATICKPFWLVSDRKILKRREFTVSQSLHQVIGILGCGASCTLKVQRLQVLAELADLGCELKEQGTIIWGGKSHVAEFKRLYLRGLVC